MDNFLVDLNHLDLLAVSGEDSGKFLQGQLTCDINAATDTQAAAGAVCNTKGRVLGSFLLIRTDEDFYLEMKPGMLESNKANLDRFIVFYKAGTADAREEFDRLGVVGGKAEALIADLFPDLPGLPGEIARHEGHLLIDRGAPGGPPRFELWLRGAGAAEIRQRLEGELPVGGGAQWELEDLRRGFYLIEPDDAGEYTPQLLSYDTSGMISFKKGCYTGQEIVARMHYRGQAKKRAYPVRLHAEALQGDGKGLAVTRRDGGQRAGETLKLLPAGKGLYEGMAVLDVAAADGGEALLLDGGGEVQVTAQPAPGA